MTGINSLTKVELLKAELDNLRPLTDEVNHRVLQKIRLDWNYNSVVGSKNSLTLEETRALILNGIAKGGKPLKDYIEMKIHNDTISWIFEIANLGFGLTEDFIKQIHESILLEPYEVESFSKDGKPALKMVEIGKYKQTPNHIFSIDGKVLSFATPSETPAKMKELLDWYAIESQKPEVNPIILAANFHYKFVKIQPFDDANGRIAKILTNLILIQFNFPPIVFKTNEKNIYHFALQQADIGQMQPFIDFIARNVINSLELYLKGGKGKNIEDIDNLEKDLIALEKKLHKLSSKIVKREKVVLLDIFDKSLLPLLGKLLENYNKFDRFYIDKKISITIRSLTNLGNMANAEKKSRTAKSIAHLRELLLNEPLELNPTVEILYNYHNFNRDGFGDVEYKNQVSILFNEFEYLVAESNDETTFSTYSKKYSEELSSEEIDDILNKSSESHKTFIEQKIEGN
jgi:Fic family protein